MLAVSTSERSYHRSCETFACRVNTKLPLLFASAVFLHVYGHNHDQTPPQDAISPRLAVIRPSDELSRCVLDNIADCIRKLITVRAPRHASSSSRGRQILPSIYCIAAITGSSFTRMPMDLFHLIDAHLKASSPLAIVFSAANVYECSSSMSITKLQDHPSHARRLKHPRTDVEMQQAQG